MRNKNNTIIFNPHEKKALLHILFDKEPRLKKIMEKIILGFETMDYEKLVQGKRDEKTILELFEDDEEEFFPLLDDFYKNGCGYKDDHPRRRKLKAGIFYTIAKLLIVRCNYQKGLKKLMYAATLPNLPDEFAPLFLFRLGSIYIEQGMISEAGDNLDLAAHRCRMYSGDPVMFNLELLTLYQILRVHIIKGNLLKAKNVIEDLKRKLEEKENIIFSSLQGYYYRVSGEYEKGIEKLNKAYLIYKEDKEIQKTLSRPWFNTLYQLAFCHLEMKNKVKAYELMAEAFLTLEDYNYRNHGYYEDILGLLKMTGDDKNLGEALAHFQRAYNYFHNYSDFRNMARSKRYIGKVFVEIENYPEAIRNFNQSLDYDFRTQLDIGIVHTLLEKIDLRIKLIQYYKAREYLDKIEEIKLPLKHYLQEEIKKRKEVLKKVDAFQDELIGVSKAISDIKKEIKYYAITDEPILIIGEKGTGKNHIAKIIHKKSDRKGEFKRINCSSIPSDQFEREIFGQAVKTNSGKIMENLGLLEMANHGTAFFEVIGSLPSQLQAKLDRFIEDKTIITPKNGKEKMLDVKLIFSTSKNLEEEIDKGNFNHDLYDKISDFKVSIPPLKERREDVKKLAEFFYVTECRKIKKDPYGIGSDALSFMEDYSWPGNIRELQKVIKRCVIKLDPEEPITRESVINVLDSSQLIIEKKVQEPEASEEEVDDRPLRISDSLKTLNDVFRIIQEYGPVRKSKIIECCSYAEKSFHHWIKILKDKYQVIEENKAGNFNVYTAAPPEVLRQKIENGELEKTDNIYAVVEQ